MRKSVYYSTTQGAVASILSLLICLELSVAGLLALISFPIVRATNSSNQLFITLCIQFVNS